MTTNEVSRRGFIAAAGAATAAGAAGTAAAAESPTATESGGTETAGGGNESDASGSGGGGGGNEVPVFPGYLSDANLYSKEATLDARGQDTVTVSVGAGDKGVSFDPATIWIDPGTTVTWEWTGDGGGHNVKKESGRAELDSGQPVSEEGTTYEFEFTEDHAGITTYKCIPHEAQGMKGGVAVGDDVETTTIETGAAGPSVEIPDEALALTVATFFAMTTTLGLGYFFMKFGGEPRTE